MKHLILLFVPLVLSACKGEPEDTEVRPPSAPVVSLDPDPATSADDISVVIDEESVDPAGRSVTYLYEWSSDASGTYEGATLPAAQTAKGETWTATATPNNGAVDGPSGDANTTILNSLPSIASVSISPDPAYANSDLTCTANGVVDADGESVTLAYAWTVEGTAAGSASTLASTEFGRYEDIVCTVTPSDSDGTGTAVTSPTLTISNRPPSITGASVTPTTAYTDTTLTCTPSGWLDEDGDSEGYSYAWTAGGSAVGGDTATLDGSNFSKGQSVVCTVTPTDGSNDGTPVPSTGVTILNTAPSISSVGLSPSTVYTNTVVECQPAGFSDADQDFGGYLFEWTKQVGGIGAFVAVGTNDAFLYGATDFDRNDKLVCTVTPTDLEDLGTPLSSDESTVSNTLPTATSVLITPDPAVTTDFLLCTANGTDDDSDTVNFDYAWTVEGDPKGGNFNTLSSTHFSKGKEVICTATSKDAFGSG
ncbi:MAG: hypothetical protein JRJ84_18380, partial [Deltaproteobacteria bacterium]|nr:hypothetical protein [Deltaproteobacteria bacterium]